jgi:anti-sigma factor RsiW
MNCLEYGEIIAAHVDGALSPEEEREVQSHLNQCPKCTQIFVWEIEAKKSLGQKLSPIPARPGLRIRVLDQLGERRGEGLFGWFYMPHGLAAAVGLLLILAVPYLVWQNNVQNDILTNAVAQYQNVTRGIIDAAQVSPSLPPPARLLDLSPWGYRVLAKQRIQVEGGEGRVFVYQRQEKEYLLAQEFDRGDYTLPHGATTIRVSGQDFLSYSKGDVNLIGWKEKDLLCILTSNLPKDELLRLAQEIALGS